jgi:ATP-dependent DNA helicase UvrD/PcrA
VRGDLQHLFGDRALLQGVVAAAKGRIPAYAIDEVLEHTRTQFGMTGEEAWATIEDRQRLVAVDRRRLDEGTPDADAGTVDTEDYAVLFELDRMRAARVGDRPARPRAFDCLVVDEAQEFSTLELALLGRSVARRSVARRRGGARGAGTLVVAGDADQQLDDRACFFGWDATMQALGHADGERVVLDIGYRCPPHVVAVARHVLGTRPAEPEAIDLTHFASEADLGAWLAATAERLLARSPPSSVAIIARSPLTARRLADRIRNETPARLVLDGQFRPFPGIDVTTVDQVRGLEFEHVIVPDATGSAYGTDPISRRALYVAITRARNTVRFGAVGSVATILV